MSRSKRMGRVHYQVCWSILLLNRIPRYGRYYTVDMDKLNETGSFSSSMTKHWSFRWNGHWGITILDKLGWLWDFADEAEYREALKQSNG